MDRIWKEANFVECFVLFRLSPSTTEESHEYAARIDGNRPKVWIRDFPNSKKECGLLHCNIFYYSTYFHYQISKIAIAVPIAIVPIAGLSRILFLKGEIIQMQLWNLNSLWKLEKNYNTFSKQYASAVLYGHLWPARLCRTFLHCCTKRTIFGKILLNIKRVFSLFHCSTVRFNSLSFIHTNSCSISLLSYIKIT